MTDTAMNRADSAQDDAAIWMAGYHKGQHNAMTAPTWWKCHAHGPAKAGAWGCPECVREMRDELLTLRRAAETAQQQEASPSPDRARTCEDGCNGCDDCTDYGGEFGTYARHPLTAEQIAGIFYPMGTASAAQLQVAMACARAIEAAHGIK